MTIDNTLENKLCSGSVSDPDVVRVLHVDDDPMIAETAAEFLNHEEETTFDTSIETNASDALDRLAERDIDCIISDYDMPGMDGLEFLEAVRDDYPDLPFILFTGKGSEEIASEAISAGVTDYLQKSGSTDQYTVLANRITNAVSQYRAEKQVTQTRKGFQKLVEHSTDVISIVDQEGRWRYLTPSSERILGYTPDELVGEIGFEYVHPDDRSDAIAQFNQAIEQPDGIPTVEFRFNHPDNGWVWLANHARNMVDDPIIQGFVVHTRDITERKEKGEELHRRNQQLEEFASVLSHDLRNPLSVATARLELAQTETDSEYLDDIETALERMDTIIDKTLTLARSGQTVGQQQPVNLSALVKECWQTVATATAELRVDVDTFRISADPDRLRTLLENLFRNAVEHGGEDVTVQVGTLPDGFYIADDGPGIPEAEQDTVFEPGFSTQADGTGLGLAIVKRIVEAHDWEIQITSGEEIAGTRIDITNVESIPTHD